MPGMEFKDNYYALLVAIFTNDTVTEALSEMGLSPYKEGE